MENFGQTIIVIVPDKNDFISACEQSTPTLRKSYTYVATGKFFFFFFSMASDIERYRVDSNGADIFPEREKQTGQISREEFLSNTLLNNKLKGKIRQENEFERQQNLKMMQCELSHISPCGLDVLDKRKILNKFERFVMRRTTCWIG